MVTRYAPPIENHTENYIRYVSEWSGVGVDVPLDTQSDKVMIPVVAAMSRIENGIPAVLADVDAGWNLYQTHKP